ncbi:SMC family ATPase [Pseudanabaena sp. FACHB-1998]|uniref:AAA family ATPase n=1 Tax=Pseudanabaena sp. FACHB-1998 TaxID=2692858 RepID=UPI0016810094|nr:SMC family ATPase [Pseudanabaena sp. FACHB-1998]MBD2175594.1 SMC family ATPase [Pseudanabaena sp. FACHB-1998]
MIPQKLRLKNFLSYQQLALDFSGLHVACICGANGAGKSSLLEAISWAVWGASRAASEDDVIHVGSKETQVDFTFIAGGEVYRVIRTRSRNSSTSLEFQVQSEGKFKSLTERKVRSTQQTIISHLKMDYETFVNSAYLRQGRADEFMLKRPSDRKQILADMLALSQYDELAERAKDIARTSKAELAILENLLTHLQEQILAGAEIAPQLETLRSQLTELQAWESRDRTQLQTVEDLQKQYTSVSQQLTWQQQQQNSLASNLAQIERQLTNQQKQLQQLEGYLLQRSPILQDYERYQLLSAQEAELDRKLQKYQQISDRRGEFSHKLASLQSDLKGQLRHYQAQLESLVQQESELQGIRSRATEIEGAIAELHKARAVLQEFDRLHAQSTPLVHRYQTLKHQLEREETKLTAKLEELVAKRDQLQLQVKDRDRLLGHAQELDRQIEALQKKQVYQQRVHEKGLERRDFLERLKSRLADSEAAFKKLEAKMRHLTVPNAPCPLCDRPLDEAHWQLVQKKHKQESRDLQADIWVVKEQQAASNCEIEVLRDEYRNLKKELAPLNDLIQRKGTLQERLKAISEAVQRLGLIDAEIQDLGDRLRTKNYLREAWEEMELIDKNIHKFAYDEKNHALARGDVERWRWAEIKQSELKNAQRQADNLSQKIPDLQTKIHQLQERLTKNLIDLEVQHELEQCDRTLTQLGYEPDRHQQLRSQKQELTPSLLRYQELTRAEQEYPELQQQVSHLQQAQTHHQQELQTLSTQIIGLEAQVQALHGDHAQEIQALKQNLQNWRSQMDSLLAQIGSLQQAQQQLEQSHQREQETLVQIETARQRQRIHNELYQAFGKNGIQALMLENVLPQIEVEANQILAQLSDRQLNVRFITQKSGKKSDRIIETLDIEIADTKGTRPYETYSGGEAFRINFAVRLALSRVLAQRKGSTLQTLIIDEGFGSQDQLGCDRLVSAINAIAPDFECILVITHMPQMKEAFNTLIEVSKGEEGSMVQLVG